VTEILIAIAAFLAGLFGGPLGHVAPVCVNAPVAIHVTTNSGLEMSPTLHGALLGQPPTC